MFRQICTQTPDTTSGPFSSRSTISSISLSNFGPNVPSWISATLQVMAIINQRRDEASQAERVKRFSEAHTQSVRHPVRARKGSASPPLRGHERGLRTVTLQSPCLKLQHSKWGTLGAVIANYKSRGGTYGLCPQTSTPMESVKRFSWLTNATGPRLSLNSRCNLC